MKGKDLFGALYALAACAEGECVTPEMAKQIREYASVVRNLSRELSAYKMAVKSLEKKLESSRNNINR